MQNSESNLNGKYIECPVTRHIHRIDSVVNGSAHLTRIEVDSQEEGFLVNPRFVEMEKITIPVGDIVDYFDPTRHEFLKKLYCEHIKKKGFKKQFKKLSLKDPLKVRMETFKILIDLYPDKPWRYIMISGVLNEYYYSRYLSETKGTGHLTSVMDNSKAELLRTFFKDSEVDYLPQSFLDGVKISEVDQFGITLYLSSIVEEYYNKVGYRLRLVYTEEGLLPDYYHCSPKKNFNLLYSVNTIHDFENDSTTCHMNLVHVDMDHRKILIDDVTYVDQTIEEIMKDLMVRGECFFGKNILDKVNKDG